MQPDSQSEVYERYRRVALTKLTSEIPNNERLTVNMLAARRGAKGPVGANTPRPKGLRLSKREEFPI